MLERLVGKPGPGYILWMMIITRFAGTIGGAAVVYYVQLTVDLSGPLRTHFYVVATAVVLLSITVTVLLALWETRTLRCVMRRLHAGDPVSAEMGSLAGREAVVFPVRHHLREAMVVPFCCLPPVYVYLTWAADAPLLVLVHITIATFMGVASALSITYFAIDRLMYPVIRHLLGHGVVIDYENLPLNHLQSRMLFSFTLTVVVTALMIATLANQKLANLVDFPGKLDEVVASMRLHTIVISACAVLMALLLSTLLARSISTRVQHMVDIMNRVEGGNLHERITAVATDEIGVLGRSFNKMVGELEQNEATIRELNVNLERKVRKRTAELEESKRELEYSYERLKEQDRLKTEFFSNVSHELRTPLTLILTPVENMLEGNLGTLQAEQRQTMAIVHRNTVRLLNLINDLLDFSKLEAGKSSLRPVATDINEVIDELVSSASLLAVERGIRLSFDGDPAFGPVMLDREKIEKAIINLLSNALKFTGKGGRVEVRSASANGELTVSVKDSGIGISPEDQEKIYLRFVQIDGSTSRQYEGTGLGLPLAKEFVELHDGRMHVESEVGKGSCFSFIIPLIPSTGEAERPERRAHLMDYSAVCVPADGAVIGSRAVPSSDAATVLIVDDSPDVLTVLTSVLGSDYHILEAGDGRAGLELALQRVPDLILSDVMMPHMDGYEFCSHTKANPRTARIPFVMLTAKADLSMKIEGLEQGADDYLVKPFNPEELRARVRSLLKVGRLDRQLDARNAELEASLAELKRAQNHLVQSEKLRSLGQLSAGIAHEINNAINVVYNGIRPLHRKMKQIEQTVAEACLPATSNTGASEEDESSKPVANVRKSLSSMLELATVIETGAKRTAEIVTDLKKFAHPGKDSRSMFDVHEALDTAINLLSNKTKNRVHVDREYCCDGEILCSGTQLIQVFMNILDNAQQAISGNGSVHICTRRSSEHMIIRIRDTGAGIPSEACSRIFDPFFTTKEVGEGTGLGLSISYGIVESHGGSIEVSSPPPGCQHGTEFTIMLPCATDDEPARPAQSADQPKRNRDQVPTGVAPVSNPWSTDAPSVLERTT